MAPYLIKDPRRSEARCLVSPRLSFPVQLSLTLNSRYNAARVPSSGSHQSSTRSTKGNGARARQTVATCQTLWAARTFDSAYLQIAAEIPPESIIVRNLKKFQHHVSGTLNKLYPVYEQYAYPCNISVDRLLEILHIVVRDPSHILNRKPPALHLSGPSSLMALAHLLS